MADAHDTAAATVGRESEAPPADAPQILAGYTRGGRSRAVHLAPRVR